MTISKKLATLAIAAALALSGCSAADVASRNISTEADEFRVDRRIVGINLITGDYLFVVTGKCSIEPDEAESQLEITCKVGENAYQKHFIGIPGGANVTYTAEQLATTDVSAYHYEFVFKPEVILPTVVR